MSALGEMVPDLGKLAQENVQARLRMVALMGLSNTHGHMLLTTGNKSEMSVGYATLYGDMAGGYSVLKDAYKTTVFALSRWRNRVKPEGALGPDGPVMPDSVITKPPTAELSPGQKDEDTPAALLAARPHARRPGRQGNVGAAKWPRRPAPTRRSSPNRAQGADAPNISAARRRRA